MPVAPHRRDAPEQAPVGRQAVQQVPRHLELGAHHERRDPGEKPRAVGHLHQVAAGIRACRPCEPDVSGGEAPRPDCIVVPSGTGGTLAGLTLGAAVLGWPTTIVGVRITERIASNRAVVRYEIGSMKRLLARRAPRFTRRRLPPVRFEIDHRAIGPGYGMPTPASIAAIPEVERLIGVPGEVTYSAKALAALRGIAHERPRETILLWQTLSSARPPLAEGGGRALPPAWARDFDGEVAY